MTTQRKARGAYSVGQATRESILSAAMVLIAERGYNGFSLARPPVVESVFPTPPRLSLPFQGSDPAQRDPASRGDERPLRRLH